MMTPCSSASFGAFCTVGTWTDGLVSVIFCLSATSLICRHSFLHVPAFRPRNTSLTDSIRCTLHISLKSSPSVIGVGRWGGGSISPQIFSLVGLLFAWVCVARELLNLKSRQEKLFEKKKEGRGALCWSAVGLE